MNADQSQGIPQYPRPDEGDPPREERDPRTPTATAPDSVEESETADTPYVGKDGPDAADAPTAEGKPAREGEDLGSPGAELDPDEGADVLETQAEAREIKDAQDEDRRDEDLISLDGSD